FNLFNHQNVTQLETTGYYIQRGSSWSDPPTLNFLTGVKTDTTAFGMPLNINATNFYRERQIQFGMRMRFWGGFGDATEFRPPASSRRKSEALFHAQLIYLI